MYTFFYISWHTPIDIYLYKIKTLLAIVLKIYDTKCNNVYIYMYIFIRIPLEEFVNKNLPLPISFPFFFF